MNEKFAMSRGNRRMQQDELAEERKVKREMILFLFVICHKRWRDDQ